MMGPTKEIAPVRNGLICKDSGRQTHIPRDEFDACDLWRQVLVYDVGISRRQSAVSEDCLPGGVGRDWGVRLFQV